MDLFFSNKVNLKIRVCMNFVLNIYEGYKPHRFFFRQKKSHRLCIGVSKWSIYPLDISSVRNKIDPLQKNINVLDWIHPFNFWMLVIHIYKISILLSAVKILLEAIFCVNLRKIYMTAKKEKTQGAKLELGYWRSL